MLYMIYLAADHRGFVLKETLKVFLTEEGFSFEDVGAFTLDPEDDYVDFAINASEKIAQDPANHKGILLCGSGHGMDVVANKYKGLHAAWVNTHESAVMSRAHGNTNVLVLGADWLREDAAKDIVGTWLKTPFNGEERHVRRLKKIEEVEARNFR